MHKKNIYKAIPDSGATEWCEHLFDHQQVTIERIVSRGHCSPDGFWYDQNWDEWVLLLAGRAGLVFEDENKANRAVHLEPGDHLLIPARVRHRVAWTARDAETIWLAVHIRPPQQTGPD
jgi:cupin 2 domain-containing protein